MTCATLEPTSIPTSSSSFIGPTGKPKSTNARSMSSTAAPSLNMNAASFTYGARMREV